uniref:(northern house mosquito) hypothetical protein n=1 Tax=Culex pipiens TaxID=7175 RepID=A0A8D8MPC0_CULPI
MTNRNAINDLMKRPNLSMSGSATKTELAGFGCLCIYLFFACEIHVCFTNFQFFLIIFGSRLAQLTHFCSLTIKAFTSPLLLYLMTHFFSFKCFFSSAESISITAEIYTSPKFLHHFIDFSSIYFSLVNV